MKSTNALVYKRETADVEKADPFSGNLRITVYFLLLLTLTGLLFSRALLSVSMMLWVSAALIFYKLWWKGFKKDPLLCWSLVPVVLFLFGAWQSESQRAGEYLLSLLNYPAAVVGLRLAIAVSNFGVIVRFWILAVIISLIKPLYHLINNKESLYELYARAKTLGVWMDGDHTRYGLFLCAGLLLLLSVKTFHRRWVYIFTAVLGAMIILIAIRTAWVGALIILAIFIVQNIIKPPMHFVKWISLLLIPVIMFASYFFLPSVKGKVDYMVYEWHSYNSRQFDINFSDGTRMAINRAAWQSIQEGEANLGWGNIPQFLNKHLSRLFPNTNNSFGLPFNQWLYWWMGGGVWAMTLFTAWILYPLFMIRKLSVSFPLLAWTIVIVASCLVESTLVFQFGIVLHAWIITMLWMHKELAVEQIKE